MRSLPQMALHGRGTWIFRGILASVVTIAVIIGIIAVRQPSPPSMSAPTVSKAYSIPQQYLPYRLFVSDLEGGNVGLLGDATLLVGGGPHGLALQPDGKVLWVTNANGSNVWLVDITKPQHPQVIAAIEVGAIPVHIVFTPNGATAYVTLFGADSITVVDVASRKVTGHIMVPLGPHGIAISPDGTTLYVACPRSGALVIVDTQRQMVTEMVAIAGGTQPYGVAISTDGSQVYVTDVTFKRVLIIDTASQQQIGAVPLPDKPALITIIPHTNKLAVSNGDGISIISLATRMVIATIATPGLTHGVSASFDGTYLFVATTTGQHISVITVATVTLADSIAVGRYPIDIVSMPRN